MAELTIKLKYGEFELELKGDESAVKEEFKEIRTHGLDKILGNIGNPLHETKLDEGTPKEKISIISTPDSEPNQKAKSPPVRKSVKATVKSSKLVNSLNLKPSDKESLKEFYSKYVIKSGFENNVIFIYYLEKTLSQSNIGVDHIYTCYKDVGQKVPGNLRQNIIDTKRNKGWIETDNMDDLRLTQIGENYVEHDALRASNG